MLPSVIMIALFVITVILISYTSIKSEYVLIVFLMLCGIATGVNEGAVLKKSVFAAIALVLFFIIKINVNMFIKASNYIYFATVILLMLALLSEPIAEGSHRYLIIGPVIVEPAPLVAFSILPACNLINKMKRITYADMALILLFGGIELCLILLLPYIELAFVMCIVAFVMLVKIKAVPLKS